jgi:hypothetical protein
MLPFDQADIRLRLRGSLRFFFQSSASVNPDLLGLLTNRRGSGRYPSCLDPDPRILAEEQRSWMTSPKKVTMIQSATTKAVKGSSKMVIPRGASAGAVRSKQQLHSR